MDYTELREVVMSDNRGIAYNEDGLHVYRASGAGSCLRALVASMLGYRESRSQYAETILQDAAKEGNLHEGAILAELAEMGHKIEGRQDLLETTVLPKVVLRGHVDGVGFPPRARNNRGYEAKTMSKEVFRKFTRPADMMQAFLSGDWDRYAWQLSIYMHMLDMPFIYAVKNRDSGKLIVEEITRPPVEWRTIKRRIIQAEKWALKDELPPCDVASGEKFFCPFPALHDEGDSMIGMEDPDEQFQPITSVTDVVLIGMAEKHAELSKVITAGSRANDERKDLNEKILTAMPTDDVIAGPWHLKKAGRAGRKTTDWAGVAKEVGVKVEKLQTAIEANSEAGKRSEWPKIELTGVA